MTNECSCPGRPPRPSALFSFALSGCHMSVRCENCCRKHVSPNPPAAAPGDNVHDVLPPLRLPLRHTTHTTPAFSHQMRWCHAAPRRTLLQYARAEDVPSRSFLPRSCAPAGGLRTDFVPMMSTHHVHHVCASGRIARSFDQKNFVLFDQRV